MRVAIVGAGMAGLAAARTLVEKGHEVVVFEKSRGVGGRAATRRKDGFVWDTGATAIPEEMLTLSLMRAPGLVRIDRPVWINEDLKPVPGNPRKDSPRYAFPAGMSSLGKLFAKDIDVRLETRIEKIGRVGNDYELMGEAFEALVLTAPIPQTRVLLETLGEIRPLAEAEYRPCLSILLGYDVALPMPPYVALLSPQGQHRLQWLSLESEKCPDRASAGGSALVCQMSTEFSASHYDAPSEFLVSVAAKDLAQLYGPAFARPVSTDVMRWRYSQPIKLADFDAVNPPDSRIAVASDGLLGGKLPQAYKAGQRAVQRLRGWRL